jgi:hypothetical protein
MEGSVVMERFVGSILDYAGSGRTTRTTPFLHTSQQAITTSTITVRNHDRHQQ